MVAAERTDSVVLLARFVPGWGHIDPLREYSELCVKGRAKNGIGSRVAMVVHELLENAVKYGDPAREIELTLRLVPDGTAVEVRVENRAHPTRTALLAKEFSRSSGGDSARDAFVRALQRLQRLPEGASMLGLARIALEATLTAEIETDRVVFNARVESKGAVTRRA